MRDKISKLHESLLSIGLENAAKHVQAIDSLYVIAASDFGTEIRVLQSIIDLLNDIKDLKMYDEYRGNKFLPGYAIETAKERSVKNAEPIQGYTKKQILDGVNNYLHSFIKNYMEVRSDRINFENEGIYDQVMNTIENALKEYNKATRSVSKGSVQKLLFKTLRTVQDIDLFVRIVKHEARKIKDPRWISPIEKSIPAKNLLSGTSLTGGTWAEVLTNLPQFNPKIEMDKMDEEYMRAHDMSPIDFYHMIKNFRSHIQVPSKVASFSNMIIKTADDDDIEFSDPDDDEEEDIPATPAKSTKPTKPTLKEEKKEVSKKEDKKAPGWGAFAPFSSLFEEPTNLRSIVIQVISSGSLLTKDKSGMHPLSPVIIYRAYSQSLLPQFRDQYNSLISSAHQIHVTLYQVEAIQASLTKSLVAVVRALGEAP